MTRSLARLTLASLLCGAALTVTSSWAGPEAGESPAIQADALELAACTASSPRPQSCIGRLAAACRHAAVSRAAWDACDRREGAAWHALIETYDITLQASAGGAEAGSGVVGARVAWMDGRERLCHPLKGFAGVEDAASRALADRCFAQENGRRAIYLGTAVRAHRAGTV